MTTYEDLALKWSRRLAEAHERNAPHLEVTPDEMHELREMEVMRLESLTPQQVMLEELRSLNHPGLPWLLGTPVVVVHTQGESNDQHES